MSDRPDIGYDYRALDELEKTARELAYVMGYDHIEWIEQPDAGYVWLRAFREGEPVARTDLIGFYGELLSHDLSNGRYPLDRPMILPVHFGKLDWGVFSLVYQSLKYRLDIELRKLIDGQTSKEFLLQFGRLLHDKYQEKYPINAKTQLIEVDTQFASYAYVLPHSLTHSQLTTKVTHFERWGLTDPATWVMLAYAPEINIVYVRKDGAR